MNNLVSDLIFNIDNELASLDEESIKRLRIQNKNLGQVSDLVIEKEQHKLENLEQQATPLVRTIIEHMLDCHVEFNDMLASKLRDGKITKDSYARYLIQAWYHTRFTPEFEALFANKLAEYIKGNTKNNFEKGNKFLLLVESGIDEEAGHELWAIQDLQNLEYKHFDIVKDVYPESKALISTQFDRINRLNFKGFLGYSFYLEYWVAKYSKFQLQILESCGIPSECQSFIHNHYVVDQGHAFDNIELLNFLIDNEADATEVIDNMNIIHMLYFAMVAKSFN